MTTLRIGTSGWVYPHWKGAFYPAGLPQRLWLEHYAARFDTVEVNLSFYRLPKAATFDEWRRRTPEAFLFAVKGSRFITHVKRLLDPEPLLLRLLDCVDELGAKAGPLLWQLPPRFPRDVERLKAFLGALPCRYRHAFEFRDPSWYREEVYRALEAVEAALVIPDRAGQRPADVLTAPWTYLRFHWGGGPGGGYAGEEIASQARRIADLLDRDVDVYAYFNNDQGAHAPEDAARLAAEVEARRRGPAPRAGGPRAGA